ncbi:hypothetical protein BRC81_15655 [Halobacteriales archaeon QS_1_68_20]|nr:MAG: hypothetical protein BRC81_15655 [Halobacteriales archaeon QS_1_68_20]
MDEDEALLTQWEVLQDRIQQYKTIYHRRIVGGTVVLAAVAGYGVSQTNPWLLAFIPVIVGLIFVAHVQEANNVYYLDWQCYRIERELPVDGFSWTQDFSGLVRPNCRTPGAKTRTLLGFQVPWSSRVFPSVMNYALGLVTYGLFAAYAGRTLGGESTVP